MFGYKIDGAYKQFNTSLSFHGSILTKTPTAVNHRAEEKKFEDILK